MKHLELHGIHIAIGTQAEVEALGLTSSLDLGNGLVILQRVTLKELLTLAGHDWNRIDSAVPQDWVARKGVEPQDWVWSYESGSAFGEPLSLRQVRREAAQQVLDLLVNAASQSFTDDGGGE